MKVIVAGGIIFVAGILIMVLGKIMLGLALLFAGLIAMAMSYSTMMRGQGYDPDQATINGLKGQGKQQSEVVKEAVTNPGEQSANIWDQMENK
jgi:hypothetical protein